MKNYSKFNAENILKNVEDVMNVAKYRNIYIAQVCEELSIFDWWKERLSVTQLKDMKKFLKEAIKLGYTGYVCFKVGATYCSNGMWAYKEETKDGYSPDGDCLYKSFTPEYNYWQVKKDGEFLEKDGKYNSIKTIKQLEEYIKTL